MYQHIIVAVDVDQHTDKALLAAGQLAKMIGARLTVVHIVNLQDLARADSELVSTQTLHEQVLQRGRTLLQQARRRVVEQHGIEPLAHLGESWHGKRDMASVLVRFAIAVDADLLVLATHSRTGIMHKLMGSFIENVIRTAPCPLMIVRSPGSETVADTPLVA
ncbi:universal stress protein [Paludibacterium purpuratum]|uniref:Nucleotide-binding universal stress UspA family protein n=1 Tax=Paludibacterium purpuratum TaxID=1144873 RepID=A0A4R7B6V3_9NEIS|nr:universal stress protein [Paludibacterium purpuratum]TDR80398.1 nucleotide-binding universal stress UspA family protein [Paludibacterium purpuratum]